MASFKEFLKGVRLRLQGSTPTDNKEGSLWLEADGCCNNKVNVYAEAAVRELLTNDQTQTVTNKDIDGGTASLTSRITVPKDTLANISCLARKQGSLYYATDVNRVYYDDGVCVNPIVTTCGTTETVSVLTEAELDNALLKATCCSSCRDIVIGGSFNITSQKELPDNTTIRQENKSFILTEFGLTNGIREISTATFTSCPFATADFDGQRILLKAPIVGGGNRNYYAFFDDSVGQCDADPALCGISIRVNTNGDVSNTDVAVSFAAALNCHACANTDFCVSPACAVATITNELAGNVTDISGCGACLNFCVAVSVQGVTPNSLFNIAACVNNVILKGLNLITASNAIPHITIEDLAIRNYIEDNDLNSPACSIGPSIIVNGQKNTIVTNNICTSSTCIEAGKIRLDKDSDGNVSSSNITD